VIIDTGVLAAIVNLPVLDTNRDKLVIFTMMGLFFLFVGFYDQSCIKIE